ncbi:unnamed protein product [Symbiodinium sp. CCMP2592]|nr:unnamed protein product [Symbiodinium sp. CCMP2592]
MDQVSSRLQLGTPGALLQAAEDLQERGLAVLDASPLKATCVAASKEALRLPPRLLRAAPTASDHKVCIADGLLGEDGCEAIAVPLTAAEHREVVAGGPASMLDRCVAVVESLGDYEAVITDTDVRPRAPTIEQLCCGDGNCGQGRQGAAWLCCQRRVDQAQPRTGEL